jgi:hypothetical protein
MRGWVLIGLLCPALALGQVFKKADQALRGAFPDAEQLVAKDVILTDALRAQIQALSRTRISDRMVTFYEARKGGELLGYAAIQSHLVRTKRETLAVIFEPDGRLRQVEIIAFLEPAEYMPPERWLAQLSGKGPQDKLAVGQDVLPITGATLSARGITEQTRWLLHALQAAKERGAVAK